MQDAIIEIATAFSAAARTWKNKKLTWSDFAAKLQTPIVKDLTFRQFRAMTKKDAAIVKDVGGYVGGYLRSGKRSPANVSYRQLLTLDIDFGTLDFWEAFTFVYDCEAVLHGTMSHEPDAPRYRLLLPLSRECSVDEYSALSRKIAGNVGIEYFDNTTFEVNRLMFWPSIAKDVKPYFESQSGAWLDVDAVLGQYRDWTDVSEWPTNKAATEEVRTKAEKQQDPLEKRGLVGAFCRTYSVEEVIEKFLSDVYAPGSEDRFSFVNGSTANGLVVYNGKFAYSHHGTDPAGGLLSNAFDLVRLHKFGDLDAAPNSLRSFKAMEAFAMEDKSVKKLLAAELKEACASDFEDEPGFEAENLDWLEEMDVDQKGTMFLSTAKNIDLVLANDKGLKGLFALSLFDSRPYLRRSAPWRTVEGEQVLKNVDLSGLRNYIERGYKIAAKEKIADSFNLEIFRNAWHPIIDYLNGQKWDGVNRVDTLFIDYFGLKDSPYAREAVRKTLCAAVARVFNPGCKWDLMPVLVGEEGLYKSMFWKKLGRIWFSDTFFKVDGKDALEQIQGAWIIEMAELAGMRKSEAESVKHFITKQKDEYRPAYGHVREEYKRQGIFVGTTNNFGFLKDPTGNRRFLPITLNGERATKCVKVDLTDEEVDQIWAEALQLYKAGEKLYLGEEAAIQAKRLQAEHMEADERGGLIESFLSRLLPKDWNDYDIFARQAFFADYANTDGVKARTQVTVAEVWVECLNKPREDMSKYNTREINDTLKVLGWRFSGKVDSVAQYGKQRIFIKLI